MPRILSIQSHVVFGYVGGKAAVFPLQCLGYDVDVVNTVHFTNHSGYGRSGGTTSSADELDAIFTALQQNHLLIPATRLLTGYIPGADALSSVARVATKLVQENPQLIYLLDPVIGDAGHLYVAPDVIPVYREMLALTTIITPNWFEVEVLTETTIKDINSLHQALRILHTKYQVPNVVISSIPLKPWLLALLPTSISPPLDNDHELDYLLCLTSSATPPESGSPHRPSTIHAACVPLIPGYFSGTGDLFSALVLAHFHPHSTTDPCYPHTTTTTTSSTTQSQTPLSHATSLALTKTHAILTQTYTHTLTLPSSDRQPSDDELDAQDPMRKIKRMRGRELMLVQGQDTIRGIGLTEDKVRWLAPWHGFWEI